MLEYLFSHQSNGSRGLESRCTECQSTGGQIEPVQSSLDIKYCVVPIFNIYINPAWDQSTECRFRAMEAGALNVGPLNVGAVNGSLSRLPQPVCTHPHHYLDHPL